MKLRRQTFLYGRRIAFVGDPQKLHITLRHNGRVMQDAGTNDMIFPVARLIEALSTFMVLEPGGLICTGSPAGNDIHHGVLLRTGDAIEGTITGPLEVLDMQRNACVAERTPTLAAGTL